MVERVRGCDCGSSSEYGSDCENGSGSDSIYYDEINVTYTPHSCSFITSSFE